MSLPWAIREILNAGQIVGLDPKEMLLQVIADALTEAKS